MWSPETTGLCWSGWAHALWELDFCVKPKTGTKWLDGWQDFWLWASKKIKGVKFIIHWRCKGCIFNWIKLVLPDCDCTVITYTSPFKSSLSRCLELLLRPFVLESSVAMTTISLWAVVMDTKGPWWSPRDDSESGLDKDIPHRIFTSIVGKQPD